MLYVLSTKYRKEIAINLFLLFYISVSSVQARPYEHASYDDYTTSSASLSSPAYSARSIMGGLVHLPEHRNDTSHISNRNLVPRLLSQNPPKVDIGGPSQPEMSSFKSVGTDNMVNLFNGSFSYNIPLLDVGGYPVNLFYGSGITMDQEASWVGLGWNINPGTINRTMRGVPDDFDGTDTITKTQSMRPDQTFGVDVGVDPQIVGFPLSLGISSDISYNNRLGIAMGFGLSAAMDLSLKGGDSKTSNINPGLGLNGSVGVNLSSRSGATVTPSIGLSYASTSSANGGDFGIGTSVSVGYNSRMGLQALHVSAEAHSLEYDVKASKAEGKDVYSQVGGHNNIDGSISFAYPSVTPSVTIPMTHTSLSGEFTFGGELFGLHANYSLTGYYNTSYLADADKVKASPAYGTMYMQKGNNDPNAMLDFNRIQDGVYTKNSVTIGMPTYSYDVFNISGEGTGGAFKAYRGDIGFVHDPFVETRDNSASIGIEFGAADGVHFGVNADYVYTPTTSGVWSTGNFATQSFAFKDSNGVNPSVYFKNPGEKAIPDTAFQNAIGGEDIVRLHLNNGQDGEATMTPQLEKLSTLDNSVTETDNIPQNFIKKRDKRTQVISCLTASEASQVALDTMIYSYNADSTGNILFGQCSSNPGITAINRVGDYRKGHHISEINVLDQDGKKYVYGLPVYNTKEEDVTMAIQPSGNLDTSLVPYSSLDNSTGNTNGIDYFYEKQEIPPYARAYLLTALVSPNYVDVTGNGITDDDMGDAIKFNYSKSDQLFKWRTPANDASYSVGLRTNPQDDKAHYIYGEREQWYLYSIESKNMVARFYVSDRQDGRSVYNSDGGLANTGNQKLDKIALYSKADLLRAQSTGIAAKPIKTVYFVYSYQLCADPTGMLTNNGTAVGAGQNGKLTLTSIYFTYNGNEKLHKNKYTFHYPTTNNPNYSYTSNDRWGTYKPLQDDQGNYNNPGGISNADYPYAVQDTAKANKYAAAWNMDCVTIPSGGKINITYESNDYGYVQSRRAANMTQILGFGDESNPSSTQINNQNIYEHIANPAFNGGYQEHQYVYIKLPVPITATTPAGIQQELSDRYFKDVNQLYMKLAVNMPAEPTGGYGGPEFIPMYADIASYGLVPDSNDVMYVQVQMMSSGHTPMVQYALQFLTSFLPEKAYPGYDTKGEGLKGIFVALAGSFDAFAELTSGQDHTFMAANKCRSVTTAESFARLSNPIGKKLGGGVRVKQIQISDNWNKMTGQYNATYGQDYTYTTTELINNIPTTISSGVASWEPSIGGEENPFREIVRTLDRQAHGPFDYGSVELPMGEMFYPSPTVGYSRVEVNSIHRDTVRNEPGMTVTEFYTTKDFPFSSSYTSLPSGTMEYHPSAIEKILKMNLKERITLSQGFKVDLNDMDGKEKSQATYSSMDSVDYITKTTNYYSTTQNTDSTYSLNHTFNTIDGPDGVVDSNGVIGRDIELMADFREHQSHTYNADINTNIDFFWIGWFPVPLINPLSPFYVDETTYRSAAVTKVVNHYGVLDSVVVVDKGSTVSTKNLVYDAETGNVLLSRTNNEHGRPVYNFSYPAHWAYSGMGPAYKNIDITLQGLTFRKGLLATPVDTTIFQSGDEMYVTSDLERGPVKISPCDNFSCTDPYLPKNTADKIWAVNTDEAGGPSHMVFIDRSGQPYTADDVTLHIFRSGHKNMLDQSVATITSLNSPIGSDGKLHFNDTTQILNTTAATFKDDWRVDDDFFRTDSAYKIIDSVKELSFIDTAHQIITVTKYDSPFDDRSDSATGPDFSTYTTNDADTTISYNLIANNYATNSSLRLNDYGDYLSRKTWIRFDKLQDSFLNYNLDTSCIVGPVTFYATAHDNTIQNCSDSASYFHPGTETGPADSVVHEASGLNGGWVSFNENTSYEGNTTIVQLMNNPWYNSNDALDWGNAFETLDEFPGTDYALSQNLGTSAGFGLGKWVGNGDAIAIKNLVQDMMLEKMNDTSAIVTPGFGFQVYQPSPTVNEQNIKCWNGNQPTCIYKKPAIEFNYFPCPSGYRLDSVLRDSVGYCSIVAYMPSACHSIFGEKAMNPYVTGVLGDWRVDSSYAYYGTRKESDPNVPEDTRTAGTIIGYEPFWNFNAIALQRNYAASNTWVWNSTITQYNLKGYEIENKDPLGRFNSGLYGYNEQLPVAVTNNSTLRETMFDGFEDYGYQTSSCASCQPRRHVDFGDSISNYIVSEQQHTGQYSLKLNPGQTLGFNAPVVNPASIDSGYGLRIKIDSSLVPDTVVNSSGQGFTAVYYNTASVYLKHHSGGYLAGLTAARITDTLNNTSNPRGITVNGQMPNYESNAAFMHALPSGIVNTNEFAVRWTGYLQPTSSGLYLFRASADDGYQLYININGTDQLLTSNWGSSDWKNYNHVAAVSLTKGQLYKITLNYFNWVGAAAIDLEWKTTSCIGSTPWAPIPQSQVYETSQVTAVSGGQYQTTDTTVRYPLVLCTQLDTVQVVGRAITDTLSLIQGREMLIGAWVKEGGTDCKCSTYINNDITVTYDGSANSSVLSPSGNIIEGWQRYEGVITIPNSATEVHVKMQNLSGTIPVYFDDIRMHPYNANMKSFVYNSSNLRLMAELDENNYATFYEYDDDGTLTRVKKETVKGIQTITESRSALQKVE